MVSDVYNGCDVKMLTVMSLNAVATNTAMVRKPYINPQTPKPYAALSHVYDFGFRVQGLELSAYSYIPEPLDTKPYNRPFSTS